jgi:hypothetical protein
MSLRCGRVVLGDSLRLNTVIGHVAGSIIGYAGPPIVRVGDGREGCVLTTPTVTLRHVAKLIVMINICEYGPSATFDPRPNM